MNRDSSLCLLDFLVNLICPECSNIKFDQRESIPDIHRDFLLPLLLLSYGVTGENWSCTVSVMSVPSLCGICSVTLPEPQWTCLGLQGSSLHAQIVFTSTQASTEWVPTSVSPCAGVGHFPQVWGLTGWDQKIPCCEFFPRTLGGLGTRLGHGPRPCPVLSVLLSLG